MLPRGENKGVAVQRLSAQQAGSVFNYVNAAANTFTSVATGNTTGATSSTTFGSIETISGGGGVSVGFSGQTLIISGATTSVQSANLVAVGNTTGSTSSTTFNTNLSFSGAGIVSVGFSGQTVIVSATQSVQTEGWTAVGNTTGATSSTSFNSNFSISGTSGISVGFSGQTLIISGPGAGAVSTHNSSAVGNTTGATSSTTFGSLESVSGAGGVSVGFSGQTMIISGPVAQTVQTEGWTAVGNTTGSTSSTSFNSNFSISGTSGISIGFSGQSIIISGPGAGAISTHNSSAIGNTTGSTSSTSFGSLESVSGAGGVSVGFSGQTMIISGPAAQTVQTEGWTAVGNTTGSTSSTSFNSNFSLSGAGGASVGFSGQTIIISAPAAQTVQTEGWTAIGQTTGSTSSTSFNSNFSLSGAGGVSVGFSGQTIIVSGAAGAGGTLSISATGNTTGSTSSTSIAETNFVISGSGGASVGLSANTLQIAAPQAYTLSNTYFPIDNINFASLATNAFASNGLSIQYAPIKNNISISRGAVYISVSPQTSAAASSGSWSATVALGLYTRNGTSYSSFLTSSAAISTTWQSNTNSASVTGVRLISVPLATLLTPNEYWIMVNISTATGGQLSATQSIIVASFGGVPGALTNPDNFGNGATILNHNLLYGQASTTTSTFILPASLGMLTTNDGQKFCNFLLQLNNYSIW